MILQTATGKLHLYGRDWDTHDRFTVERNILRNFDRYKELGIAVSKHHHYKEAMSALMPWFLWHRWSELLVEDRKSTRLNSSH